MDNIHALIQQFLQQRSVIALEKFSAGDAFTKAGVVPVHGNQFYVMKPKASHPDLPPPEFQLCKGTRQYFDGKSWQDIKTKYVTDQKESLIATALREGMEELGLRLSNIETLYDCGPYDFSSASTGKGKSMWLFAAKVKSPEDFSAADAATAERAWLTLAEFKAQGRKDHVTVLRDMVMKLS